MASTSYHYAKNTAHHDILPTLGHDQYTIAWLCALHIEMAAARAMLDNIHKFLPIYEDDNAYILGNIKHHNIAIGCLPAEGYGTNNAAKVMTNMKRTFPSLRVSLMVGIGGGVPMKHDIRLGDVVVGTRVMQYDLGKIVEDGRFQRTAFYRNPGPLLGTAVSALRARHELEPSQISVILKKRLITYSDYTRPSSSDCLFQSTYEHCSPSMDRCDDCDHSKLVPRTRRDDVMIHYGAIASGNQVMKHGVTRDNIARELDVICFEMEAAGIMDILPCLPIRGICDYSDSHKSKGWQRYAAATAAAYARELLEEIPSITRTHEILASSISELDPLPPEKRRKLLLGLFRFEQIDSRRLNIKEEHAKTCQWLLSHPSYIAWLHPANLVQHHGFLWISGKPGAGKSTIMKFACMEHNKARSEFDITASFFFNARGQYLEKSIMGMYRSLLLQLLEGYPELQTVLDNPERVPPRQTDCPPLNVIKLLFRDALFALGQRSFTCFIDALDECDEQQAVDMVQFFEDLAEESAAKSILFRICFSSRHYPYIFIQWGVRLILEDQPGHAQDLATFISSRLRVEDRALSKQLQSQLLHKAAGVFMWVILVVDILNKESRRGGMALGKRLEQIPCELSDLFKDILTRDEEDMDALLLCILWILFAKESLRPQELYHALWSGLSLKGLVDDEIPDIAIIDSSDSLSRLNRYVISSSKGLAETTKSEHPRVQFIHESIRDFFIKDKGLQQLWPEYGFDCESPSHEMIKQCCNLYINHTSVCASIRSQPWRSGSDARQELLKQYPFLQYATRYMLHHANAAAKVFPQDDFLSTFPIHNFICASNATEPEIYSTSATLFYILADKGCPELVRTRLRVDSQIHVLGERHKYPLFAALKNCHQETAVAILNSSSICRGADNITDQDGHTPLQLVMIHGPEAIASLLIQKGANISVADQYGWTPLLRATFSRYQAVARLLIEKGADVNASDKHGWTPLLRVGRGDSEITRLLIENGADVNASDKYGWTPLLHALMDGGEEIAKILIDNGADVNTFINGRTPLNRALMNRDGAVARLLIESGADVNDSDEDGRTPLFLALMGGNNEIASLLIKKGADVNTITDGRTPLLLALVDGHEEMAKLLIDKGADVNASNGNGRTPLLEAVTNGSEEIIRLLIDKGANVNHIGKHGQITPLLEAVIGGSEEIARFLIEKEADVNASDNCGWTPLLRAVMDGYEEMARFLIDKGANINDSNEYGLTPLLLALTDGHEDMAKLLIDKGADVNASNEYGRTPLLEVVISGSEKMARLLIDKGANVNASNEYGRTPLFEAAIGNREKMARLLIIRGAKVNIRNKDGYTLLQWASMDVRRVLEKLLIEKGA